MNSMRSAVLCAAMSLLPARAVEHGCPGAITARGEIIEKRFFAAPVERVREAVADAMQGAGVTLFENGGHVIRGERRPLRIDDMGLPRGDEAVVGTLEPSEQNGVEGTLVRMETRRAGSKIGFPRQSWSGTVLDETACLLTILSSVDPLKDRLNSSLARKGSLLRTAVLPAGTPVLVVLRRFLAVADIKPNQQLVLESANDVKAGEDIVIARGGLAVARFELTKDVSGYGKGAKATMAFDFVSSVNGDKIPVVGTQHFQGDSISVGKLIAFSAIFGGGVLNSQGKGFVIPAGTPFQLLVDGDQRIPIFNRDAP